MELLYRNPSEPFLEFTSLPNSSKAILNPPLGFEQPMKPSIITVSNKIRIVSPFKPLLNYSVI